MRYRLTLLVAVFAICILFLTSCGDADGSGSNTPATSVQPQTVQVTETATAIIPAITTFSIGKTYHFVVTNHTMAAQNFMIIRIVKSKSGKKRTYHVMANLTGIAPGQTKTIDYVFSHKDTGSFISSARHEKKHSKSVIKAITLQ